MCAKLTDLSSFAERMNVKPFGDRKIILTQEDREFIIAQIDEELGRNKAVLQRKCSTNIKPKTREKFQRQWAFLNQLRAKLC